MALGMAKNNKKATFRFANTIVPTDQPQRIGSSASGAAVVNSKSDVY